MSKKHDKRKGDRWKLASDDDGQITGIVTEIFDAEAKTVTTYRIPLGALWTQPMSVTDLGKRLGDYDPRTIKKWIAEGSLRARRVGPRFCVPIDSFGPAEMLKFLDGAVADLQESARNGNPAG